MSFDDRFSNISGHYARFRPLYPDALFGHLASLTNEHKRAWDCATGNGQAALKLAPMFDQVVATDASQAQIDRAFADPKIRYSVAPAEQCGLETSSVDLITVATGVHWFELDKFYLEARRVLKPGGVIACWCYHEGESGTGLNALVEKYEQEILGPYWAEGVRRWVWTHYRDLPFPFAETASPEFSMSVTWKLESLLGYLSSWSATQRYVEARGESPLSLIKDEMEMIFRQAGGEITSRHKIHLRVGRTAR